ncbi:MAG: hypothetical protein HFG03_03855 [Oscillibacter sp.]|nr:hypothetical protein [Oscillibacter sp.]
MSMNVLTLLETVSVFGAYLFVSVGLPAFVFGRKLKEHRILERFLVYFMIGNFYIMNLVYLLQLLRISYPATLALGTFVPAVLTRLRLNRTPVRQMVEDRLADLKKLTRGFMGRRTAIFRIGQAAGRKLKAAGRYIGRILLSHPIDCLLLAAFLGFIIWLQGTNLLIAYGYKASDIPVHNYWINQLCENHIFVAGIYPYGFHCVIYYLHSLFGFPTFEILRVFGFVESVMVHLMLLVFLKLCCKSRFAPYVGAFLYAGSNYYKSGVYLRFYAALPQEFGMIFILPPIYFGFAYFATHKRELEAAGTAVGRGWLWKKLRVAGVGQTTVPASPLESPEGEEPLEEEALPLSNPETPQEEEPAPPEKPKRWRERIRLLRWRESYLYLAGFAMSFSMSLTVHFYGTIIVGLFCLAMAIGYAFLFFRKQYFWSVVSTVLLGVFIAILPMLLSFLGGTKLSGSIGWGLSVIRESQAQTEVQAPSGGGETVTEEPVLTPQEPQKTMIERIWERWEKVREVILWALQNWVVKLPESRYATWIIDSFAVLVGLGFLLFLLRQRCYGAMLVSVGIYLMFMTIMQTAETLGILALMDSSRASIYFAYSLPLLISFGIDAVLSLVFLPFRNKGLVHLLSLALVILTVWHVWKTDQIRSPWKGGALESNEAITCMENIIATEDDFTWTVISANDELQMGLEYGYHYEVSTFLRDMEGVEDWSEIQLRIPTPVVFIFIEKIPLAYMEEYEGTGQPVSEEGAARPLPGGEGIGIYQGERRWVLMSRMYYWAQEFQRLYPNEMEVYLETDNFVCYRIEQNIFRLYDFAIDYDYNTRDYTQGEGDDG